MEPGRREAWHMSDMSEGEGLQATRCSHRQLETAYALERPRSIDDGGDPRTSAALSEIDCYEGLFRATAQDCRWFALRLLRGG